MRIAVTRPQRREVSLPTQRRFHDRLKTIVGTEIHQRAAVEHKTI